MSVRRTVTHSRENDMPSPSRLARAICVPFLTAVLFLALFACTYNAENSMGRSVVIVRSARARLLEATTIAHVRIVSQAALTYELNWGRTEICGYRESPELVEFLDGESVVQDFISNEPLEQGHEYIVAIRDIGDVATQPDDPRKDDRDRKYLRCRWQFSKWALGVAHIVEFNNQKRIDVESSSLVPRELREASIDGAVELATFLNVVTQIRKERERGRP